MSASSERPASAEPQPTGRTIRRVAILFAGGPAPAANAVISTCAASFVNHGVEVIGVMNGYSHLVEFGPEHPMQEGRDYIILNSEKLRRTRNTPRHHDRHRADEPRQGRLAAQPHRRPRADRPPADRPRRPHVAGGRRPGLDRRRRHAQDGQQVQAVPGRAAGGRAADLASSTSPRRSTTTTGASTSPSATSRPSRPWPRRSGTCWPTPRRPAATSSPSAWAEAPAGSPTGPPSPSEASLVLSVEDMTGELVGEETLTDPKTGVATKRKIMNIEKFVDSIVKLMLAREKRGKEHGVVVVAEGLAGFLPSSYLEGVKFDEHGHISMAATNLARQLVKLVEVEYEKRTGKKRRMTARPARLRVAVRPAARVRRHARQPARRRRVPRAGRGAVRRRHDLDAGAAQPDLHPVQRR